MIDNLKKYWFVVVICLIFVVFIGVFAKKEMDSVLRGKTADGQDVVSQINDTNYLVNDYYEDLKETYGKVDLYTLFERSVLSAIETSEEIATQAKKDAETFKQNVAAQEGQSGLDKYDKALVGLGYKGIDELNVLYEDSAKRDIIIRDYANDNKEKYVDTYFADAKPRIVSHILVKMDDPENPTATQQEKIDEINKRLADGVSFTDVAKALSDDTASAKQDGLVGFLDKNGQFHEQFLEAALKLEQGEVSEWVINTKAGRHLIKVDIIDLETFTSDQYLANYIAGITAHHKDLASHAIWNKAKDLKIEFKDDDVKNQILEVMNIKEGE